MFGVAWCPSYRVLLCDFGHFRARRFIHKKCILLLRFQRKFDLPSQTSELAIQQQVNGQIDSETSNINIRSRIISLTTDFHIGTTGIDDRFWPTLGIFNVMFDMSTKSPNQQLLFHHSATVYEALFCKQTKSGVFLVFESRVI